MKQHPFLTLFIIILLIVAGITGIFRGKLEQETTPPPPTEQPKPQVVPAEQPKLPPPAPKPTPPAPSLPRTTQRPHSAEHAKALQVAQALQLPQEQRAAALERIADDSQLTPEAKKALSEWVPREGKVNVQEIGTIIPKEGSGKLTRYRISSGEGGEDLLLTISTPEKGSPLLQSVEKAPSDKMQLRPESDALSVVEGFVEALKRGDMDTARRLITGGEVTDATLAGLCMMFEEGDLKLRERLPMRNMYHNEKNAGYLIYLSPKEEGIANSHSGNVGIELVHDEKDGWRVKAVALDNLLTHYEQAAEQEGGVYFPIVKNPQGGDSLVLYFAFDDDKLSPRSVSQLHIVAQLLKRGDGVLNISGHTDDVGDVAYNMDLSRRRAEAVKQALIADGVQAERISTHGMGKTQPRRSYKAGDSKQTISTIRSENRRAEIYLDF